MSNEQNGANWAQDGLETRLRTVERVANGAFPLVGTTAGGNAVAGTVGEYQEVAVLVGAAVSLSTGVVANVASMSLTAGDWDLNGIVSYHSATGTTAPNDVLQGISTTSATVGAQGTFSYDYVAVAITDDPSYVAPVVRVNIAATTTVYLVTKSDFAVSTLTAYGFMRARRIR